MRILKSGLFLAALALGTACSKDSPTGPGGGGPLTLGNAVTIAGAEGSQKSWTVEVPAGAAGLRVRLTGGSGDADLYLRFGARPTADAFDCSSEAFGGDEECFLPAPTAGTWYIEVVGFEAYSGLQLLAEVATGPTSTLLVLNTPITNLSGNDGSSRYFRVNVPAGVSNLVVTTSGGTGDVDVLVEQNPGSDDAPACGSAGDDNNEVCTVPTPAAGFYFVRLLGFSAYAGVTLTATVN